MHGAIVNAGARVGKNCIINSKSLIEHDAVMEIILMFQQGLL